MKYINIILSLFLALALNSCVANMSDNEINSFGDFNFDGSLSEWNKTFQNVCPSVTDAVMRPVIWNVDVERSFVISDNTIKSMSTCGLLVTLLEFPVYPPMNNSTVSPSVTEFNAVLQKSKLAKEFFKRHDCFPVLVSKYLTLINEFKCFPMEGGFEAPQIDYIEKLLASDLCMSVLDNNKKNQLMAMALAFEEKNRGCFTDVIFLPQTYTIMISIMQVRNYTPFIEEVGPRIREASAGYYLDDEPIGDIQYFCLTVSDAKLIVKYAKDFLNEQKTKTN